MVILIWWSCFYFVEAVIGLAINKVVYLAINKAILIEKKIIIGFLNYLYDK